MVPGVWDWYRPQGSRCTLIIFLLFSSILSKVSWATLGGDNSPALFHGLETAVSSRGGDNSPALFPCPPARSRSMEKLLQESSERDKLSLALIRAVAFAEVHLYPYTHTHTRTSRGESGVTSVEETSVWRGTIGNPTDQGRREASLLCHKLATTEHNTTKRGHGMTGACSLHGHPPNLTIEGHATP